VFFFKSSEYIKIQWKKILELGLDSKGEVRKNILEPRPRFKRRRKGAASTLPVMEKGPASNSVPRQHRHPGDPAATGGSGQ